MNITAANASISADGPLAIAAAVIVMLTFLLRKP